MSGNRVVLVLLRRPRSAKSNPDEKRSDPFWEFGSFGVTGCHAHNLMNSKRADRLKGARFAFAQGGPNGTRLVHLTPPVEIVTHGDSIEAIWAPHKMPFRYLEAPILVYNPHKTDFPLLAKTLRGGKRNTLEGQFASKFRSRATPLEASLANEIITVYSAMRKRATKAAFADRYTDALPKLPPCPDLHREQTYASCLEEAELKAAYIANSERNRALCKEVDRTDSKCQRKSCVSRSRSPNGR